MTNDPEKPGDKTPEAIQRHRPKQTYEMNTPGGRGLQRDMANHVVSKDQERFGDDRAAKYANVEKENIANKNQVREGERGRLTKEHQKSSGKENER